MAARRGSDEARLANLISEAEPAIRARFLAVVDKLLSTFTMGELADAIAAGRAEVVMQELEKVAQGLGPMWSSAYANTGSVTAKLIDKAIGNVVFDFDQTNARAVALMQANQLRLVREFSSEQRKATRQAMVAGIRAGANPIEQARAFRESIGLTSYQQQVVSNYRRALQELDKTALDRKLRDARFDRTVESAIDHESPMSAIQIDKMVERYRERMIQYRAETIARTEAQTAVNEGALETYRQAIDQGVVDEDAIERTWNTADDARVRDSHDEMDGQTVGGVDTPFISGDGNELYYPGDPRAPASDRVNCRCSISTRLRGPVAPAGTAISIRVEEEE